MSWSSRLRTWCGGHFGWLNSMTGTKSTSTTTLSASILIEKVSAGPDFFSDTYKQYASVQCHTVDLKMSCYNELLNPVKWRHKWRRQVSVQCSYDNQGHTTLFESSQAFPTCPLDNSTVNMKVGMKYLCNNNETENPVPIQLSIIPLACAECDDSLLFSGASSVPLCYVPFPATLLHQLFFHPLLPHLAIYFLAYLSILLFPNSYIISFWEFYFLPFSEHAQTNIIYLTLLFLSQ